MKWIAILVVALMLTGCAGKNSFIKMDLPMPDGTIAHVEASGDTLVTFNPATVNWEFTTEQIKAEQAALMADFFDKFIAIFGGR